MTALNARRGRHADQETIPPQNEVPGGPRTPLEIGETSWRNTLKRTGKKFARDRCSITAGSLAITGSWPTGWGMGGGRHEQTVRRCYPDIGREDRFGMAGEGSAVRSR